ncbi:hypothetical protein M422DRAFT_784186 [Sphaerobolus stellatus SS14]|uniref:Uncharacterized protein n=1 Tax=Sphaerobolus stellatus (strain SS14) TaxID=990650 RepID=A0A0C9UWT9_SPHS4|nr:hypothetical protein M422DRAFT_784186 [Sphaerobolus stellatus SS14]
MAARVGTSAHAALPAAQLMKIREGASEAWSRAGRVLLASTALASILAPKGAWDSEVLDVVAGGSAPGKKLSEMLGSVESDGGKSLGNIARYFVERFGFDKDTTIHSFTSFHLATYLSLVPTSSDALLAFGATDMLLCAAPARRVHPASTHSSRTRPRIPASQNAGSRCFRAGTPTSPVHLSTTCTQRPSPHSIDSSLSFPQAVQLASTTSSSPSGPSKANPTPSPLPLPRLTRNRPLRKRHKGKRVSAPLLPPPLRAHSAPQRIRIMTIVPRDFSILEDIEPIHGIPYRTMDAFLHGISESKDDTIDERTSLGRPADETSNFKLTVPSGLDVSIWSDVDTHHTACGAKESAYERRGRGYFTEHLLDSF